MDPASSSSASNSNSTHSIEYLVKCSDAMGLEQTFLFHHHTETSSSYRRISQSANQEKRQVVALMVDLIKTYHNEVFQARSWSCVECNRPATTLIHNPMSYLHLDKPQIIDFAAPCCANQLCDTQIKAHFADLMGTFGIPNALA